MCCHPATALLKKFINKSLKVAKNQKYELYVSVMSAMHSTKGEYK